MTPSRPLELWALGLPGGPIQRWRGAVESRAVCKAGTRPTPPRHRVGPEDQECRSHQPLLLQQVGGLLPLPAVLVLELLEPARAGVGDGGGG